MLVDYSDSDDDEAAAPAVASPAPPTPATAALLPPPHAIAEPPAKKVRKEINLQHLLQRQGVALPFEDAKNLPDDFFDIAPTREEDAGDKPTATRGWAALSSMLPAPKNAGKKSSSLSNSLYANAKPLNRAPTASAAKPSSMPLERTAPASHPTPAVVGPTGAAPCTSSPHASSSVGDAGDGSDAASDPAQRSQPPLATLRPRLNTSMYDVQPDPEEPVTGSVTGSVTGAGGMMYEQPAGPVMGPQVVEDGAFEGYAEPGFDMSDGKVMDISQADLRKVMGDAKQYDFAPAPQPEVKIAANFWNRSSGAVEAHYQPSSLQKRKHQINSLAADAAARAAEIAARGSKGMKSKAETAAKYGW
eukprot:CAMPEP_0174726758 /NCGR_PEP_ID=MMETSP1094-20130205/48454_1 /TAXON_ID=156173 /ORGANISM="Chrysochromulina brevifilum, Strain UTEX LB 985" /LENGTH=359 /DNA_ID=CAMNT_0015928381 /DNA_START=14 /DNA_END=1093 /DNA_ORIENTATION=-